MLTSLNATHVWDPASATSVLDPPPTSPDEVRVRFMALYQHGIESGRFEAFVWPYWMLHMVLFGLYFILVPPCWLDAKVARGSAWRTTRRWILLQAKYPLFLLFLWRTVAIVSVCRSPTGWVGYMIGLCHGIIVWWLAAIFMFREPRFDCMRLEREKMTHDASSGPVQKAKASMAGASGHSNGLSAVHSRRKEAANSELETREQYRYYWQGLPPTLGHRAAWVVDLLISLRGAGWAHQVPTLPLPPPEALAQLPASSPLLTAKLRRLEQPGLRFNGPDAYTRLLRNYLAAIVASYLFLDLFQSIVVTHDPYFSGLVDAPFPPGLLPSILSESAILVRLLRSLATGAAIIALMTYGFTILLTLGLIFVHTFGDELKAEPWMWVDIFGDPLAMLDHGLAGIWGRSWQQMMRITLTAPSETFSAACGWGPRDRLVATMVAFLISGTYHASASFAQLGHTQPIKPFLFFALQGVGVLFETMVGSVCERLGLRLAERYMRMVRCAWTLAFLCFTGPLIADDMARGGEWLSQPLPFSLVRALGRGPASGAGSDMWHGPLIWWHRDDVWWKSGFAA